MTDLFAGVTYRDPDTNRITGISFELQLAQGQVTVSIREAPASLEISRLETFQSALRELAEA